MNIAVNGLSARFGGGVSYLKNLLEQLSQIDHENSYLIFINPENKHIFSTNTSNFKVVVPRFSGRAVIRRFIWEQTALPLMLKKYEIDVLFSPGGMVPLLTPRRCRCVTLIQNMAPFSDELLKLYPGGKRKLRFLLLRKLYPFFADRSDTNIFISKYGLTTLQNATRQKRARRSPTLVAQVIYHGKDQLFRPVTETLARQFVNTHYHIDGEFVLYVSSITRYKKQLEVIKAFDIIQRQHGGLLGPNRLVLAGMKVEASYYDMICSLIERLKLQDRISYLGQVPQTHLPYLYSAASVLVFASICENCPNILIEAMACGAPIVSSDREPMPEICGNSALYFDPDDPKELAEKILKVSIDESLRQTLIINALKTAEQYSWKDTARKTLEVFRLVHED